MRIKPRNNLSWLYGREAGLPPPVGQRDMMSNMLYSSVDAVDFWDPQTAGHENHRGIFNFDFSTDGRVLVAACEGKSFLVFDPNNRRLIQARRRAHTDCVNCVRFLDTRSFVTCSDDTTVVLWDLRFLKNKVRVFAGHTSWVKNIEYASSQGLLITSGFDGTVYSWNINNYSRDEECKRKFCTEGLMRCKLTPDESKLVLSTSRGYLMVVHDLDLPHLNVNMDFFKPSNNNVGRAKSITAEFYSLFKRPTNRLELINEFPVANDAENIASLQVHPQGWCVVSRNTSKDDVAEWTCVHDIHTHPTLKKQQEEEEEEESESQSLSGNDAASSDRSARTHRPHVRRSSSSARCRHHPYLSPHCPARPYKANGQGHADGAFHASANAAAASSSPVDDEELGSDSEPSGSDTSVSDRDGCTGEDCSMCVRRKETKNHDLFHYFLRAQWNEDMRTPYIPPYQVPLLTPDAAATQRLPIRHFPQNFVVGIENFLRSVYVRKEKLTDIYQSQPRLIYSQQEPNVGRGFIKEQCFSSDGRVIVSPCGNGVRLLAFDEQCHELCDCERSVAQTPRQLHEVRKLSMHPQVVLTCCCSPTHSLFVSGSLDGSVAFLTPSL